MRTYRVAASGVFYEVACLVPTSVALVLSAGEETPAFVVLLLVLGTAGIFWYVSLRPVREIAVGDDGEVRLRSLLGTRSIHTEDIVSAYRGMPFFYYVRRLVLLTLHGTVAVHPLLRPGAFELLTDLRRTNPDLSVNI